MNIPTRSIAPALATPPCRRTTDRTNGAPAALSAMVVSPDPLLRAAWTQQLGRTGATRVDESASLTDARARIATTGAPPHLIVLDAGAAPADALTAAPGAPSRIVMIGGPGTVGAVRSSLQAGACGYLFGHAPVPPSRTLPTDLPTTPHAAPGLTNGRRGVLDVHGASRLLSRRETEILQHAADGESNAEIGDQLGLSALTVKSHLSRIGRRLGSGDRAQLVLLALRSGAIR